MYIYICVRVCCKVSGIFRITHVSVLFTFWPTNYCPNCSSLLASRLGSWCQNNILDKTASCYIRVDWMEMERLALNDIHIIRWREVFGRSV